MPPPRFEIDRHALRLIVIAFVLLAGLSIHRLVLAPPATNLHTFQGRTMGTTYAVKVVADDLREEDRARIEQSIRNALARVNERMSTWDPESEISRLNDHRSTAPFPVSSETLAVLEVARAISERSHGAFDVTVRPLVQAWGFGDGARVPEAPAPSELAVLSSRVGFRMLALDPDPPRVRKQRADVVVDLSAIAKGRGVDAVAEALEQLGQQRYLVEVGGELRAAGSRPDDTAWRVAIEEPDSEGRSVHRVLPLANGSMATSGDYRNFWTDARGRRISHTIDPRTAHPVDHGLASVSVLHPSATWADAWATALVVLGPEAGFALAEREGLAACFITRLENGELTTRRTSSFPDFISTSPAAPADVADPG